MVNKIFNKSYKSNFLIAEVGINHNGNIDQAFRLVDAAKESLADAVKFQTYTAEKRVKKNSSIYDILKKCELKFEDFYKLKKYCEKKKITFFSTPFDKESVEFLNKINVPMFKISSFDIINKDLIKEIIKTKKPTIVSTGMASLKEISNTYQTFKKNKVPISLLHCVSSYPNLEKNSYLSNISDLKNIAENVYALYPNVGENLDFIQNNNLKNIKLLYRKLDQFSWQYCNKGFFNFKNYIPKIIAKFN